MIENIGEKAFLKEIIANNFVWVAMKAGQVYGQNSEQGVMIFIWAAAEKCEEYITKSGMNELNPVQVPLQVFISAWLKKKEMKISDVAVNPKFRSKILVFSNEELQAKLEGK
jgi:hypothetical protein